MVISGFWLSLLQKIHKWEQIGWAFPQTERSVEQILPVIMTLNIREPVLILADVAGWRMPSNDSLLSGVCLFSSESSNNWITSTCLSFCLYQGYKNEL